MKQRNGAFYSFVVDFSQCFLGSALEAQVDLLSTQSATVKPARLEANQDGSQLMFFTNPLDRASISWAQREPKKQVIPQSELVPKASHSPSAHFLCKPKSRRMEYCGTNRS